MPRLYAERHCTACGRALAVGEYASRFSGRCEDCAGEGNTPRDDRRDLVIITPGKRYRDDVGAQLFVAYFAGGGTLEQVGAAFGITRERCRQVEHVALTKLAARMRRRGITAPEQLVDVDVDDDPARAVA